MSIQNIEQVQAENFLSVIEHLLRNFRNLQRVSFEHGLSHPFVNFHYDRILGGLDYVIEVPLFNNHYKARFYAIRSVLTHCRNDLAIAALYFCLCSYRDETKKRFLALSDS